MLNPITKLELDYIDSIVDTAVRITILGRIADCKRRKDEAGLKSLLMEIRTLRGDVFLTPDECSEIGKLAVADKLGKRIIATLSSGRENSRAFKVSAGMKVAE